MKRKYLFLAVTMLVVFLVTGCSSSEEKTMTCTRTMNQSGMKTNLNYKVLLIKILSIILIMLLLMVTN